MGKMVLRKQNLLDLLSETGALSVSEIASRYEVSEPTARRICARLAAEGKAQRVHGGIEKLQSSNPVYSFDRLSHEYLDEKKRIASYAASLVGNNQAIFLEAGTTLLQFALALAERLKNNELSNLVVLTNSLMNLEALHKVCRVTVIGGLYRDDRKDFTGYMSEQALKGLHFDYCFIGADAVSLDKGVMAMDIDTVRFDRELVSHSDHAVILANSAKLSRHSYIAYASVDEVSYIVTDSGLSDEIQKEYISRGIRLIAV